MVGIVSFKMTAKNISNKYNRIAKKQIIKVSGEIRNNLMDISKKSENHFQIIDEVACMYSKLMLKEKYEYTFLLLCPLTRYHGKNVLSLIIANEEEGELIKT